ncbi:hypothetical protein VULLAG_LOCUS21568 [Vulpes lagopus]
MDKTWHRNSETSGFLEFFCEQEKNKSKKNSYLG